MAYIGKQPLVGNYISCDSLSASATTTYNLASSGTPVFPTVPQNCIVSLNGVVQAPVTSFTISGSAIVFSTTLSTTDSIDYITVLGNTLNIGTPSNNTVGLSQFSATGTPSATTFLRGDNSWATPAADLVWQSVQTTSFTAVAGRAYPINTTSAGITVTLPASPTAGDQVQIVDYAGTFDTNALIINPNSNKILAQTSNVTASKDREAITLTYIDATQGWLPSSGYQEGTNGISIPYSVDFLVIAGGGGGGGTGSGGYSAGAGGGGAGGYRNSYASEPSGGGGSSEASLTFIPGTVYTVTVGAGGSGRAFPSSLDGGVGSNSSISGTGITTITSVGGGGGGRAQASGTPSLAGGSGGGGGNINGVGTTGGSGTANQGFNGGTGGTPYAAGGGGGAGAVGSNSSVANGGNGGNGLASSITGSSVTRAGGGGGGAYTSGTSGTGGTGGGANAGLNNATVNTGGGGGGDDSSVGGTGSGSGGKGVVILRMPTASYSGNTTGSPTVTTDGSDTVIVFNDSGSITG